MKVSNLGPEPRLYAQLNAFNIIEDNSPHKKLIFGGTLEEIDNAFRVGKISPYDIDHRSRNICHYVRILPLTYAPRKKVIISNFEFYSLQHSLNEWTYSYISIAMASGRPT